MAKITEEQVCAAFEISKKVFSGDLKKSEGVNVLVSNYYLNKASAGDFIQCFKCMLEGRIFQRAMSCSAMDYFLEKIDCDFSPVYLKNAVKALDLHIEYWERHYQTNVISMRNVSTKYKELIQKGLTVEIYQDFLNSEVLKSLNLSKSERLGRIANSKIKPKKLIVSTTIYQRNPDVVAESLVRAAGVCERCNKDAPFIRLKDKTPYLEVHHIQRLADDGLDVLENTMAICPNCH